MAINFPNTNLSNGADVVGAVTFTYDKSRDAFIPPKLYPSWVLNEDTCLWDAPVAMPDDGQRYIWNEENTNWDIPEETTNGY